MSFKIQLGQRWLNSVKFNEIHVETCVSASDIGYRLEELVETFTRPVMAGVAVENLGRVMRQSNAAE